MEQDFNIWKGAVTSFLRDRGINEWHEGPIGDGYAIWGVPGTEGELEQALSEFNKSYMKSSIRNRRLPDGRELRGLDGEQDCARVGELEAERLPTG
jgi:hypothetical protein